MIRTDPQRIDTRTFAAAETITATAETIAAAITAAPALYLPAPEGPDLTLIARDQHHRPLAVRLHPIGPDLIACTPATLTSAEDQRPQITAADPTTAAALTRTDCTATRRAALADTLTAPLHTAAALTAA